MINLPIDINNKTNFASGNLFHFINRSEGNTIITVMISLGLMSIISLGIASMFNDFNRQSLRLSQKMAVIQFQNEINSIFMNKDKCRYNFGPNTINLAGVLGAPNSSSSVYKMNRHSISEIRDGNDAAAPLILSTGAEITNIQGVKVMGVEFINWYNPSPDNYRADVVVLLSSNSGPIAPIQVRNIRILTSGPVASKSILYCGAPGKGSASFGPVIPANTWSIPTNSPSTSTPSVNIAFPSNAISASVSGTCTISSQNGGSTLKVVLKDAANNSLQTLTACSYWGVSTNNTGSTKGSVSFPIPVGIVSMDIVGNISTDGVWTGGSGDNSISYNGQIFVDDLF